MPPRVAEELHSYIRHNYMEGLEYEGYEYDDRREDEDEGDGNEDDEGGHDRGDGNGDDVDGDGDDDDDDDDNNEDDDDEEDEDDNDRDEDEDEDEDEEEEEEEDNNVSDEDDAGLVGDTLSQYYCDDEKRQEYLSSLLSIIEEDDHRIYLSRNPDEDLDFVIHSDEEEYRRQVEDNDNDYLSSLLEAEDYEHEQYWDPQRLEDEYQSNFRSLWLEYSLAESTHPYHYDDYRYDDSD